MVYLIESFWKIHVRGSNRYKVTIDKVPFEISYDTIIKLLRKVPRCSYLGTTVSSIYMYR